MANAWRDGTHAHVLVQQLDDLRGLLDGRVVDAERLQTRLTERGGAIAATIPLNACPAHSRRQQAKIMGATSWLRF
jgi:hypothetical protein